jgi:periplasmic protein CpxP/Spy
MKKLIAALSLSMLVVGSAYAQTTTTQQDRKPRSEMRAAMKHKAQKNPEEVAQMKTDRMAQKLELSEAQKNQLQTLNLRHAQEMKAMRESHKAAGEKTAEQRTQMQEARKASHNQWQAELKGILSAEQFAKYEADKAEMKQKRGEGKKGHKGGDSKKKGDYQKTGDYQKKQQRN